VAGYGYGSQTLPLISNLVGNIAKRFSLFEDAGKNKKKYLVPQGHAKPEEAKTVAVIKATERLVRRVTGTHASSLGFASRRHFYAANIRHQPTTVLAVAQFLDDIENLTNSSNLQNIAPHLKIFL